MRVDKLPGFTLLELIMVIAIAAILLGLGISALLNLRDRTRVKLAVDEFVLEFNTTRNLARNSVLSGRVTGSTLDADIQNAQKASNLDYYGLVFVNQQTYYRASCSTQTSQVNCTDISGNLKGNTNAEVNIDAGTQSDQYCKVILFNLSTGKFNLMNSNYQVSPSKKCEYVFSHTQNPLAKITLTVDSVTGKIDILGT